MRLHFLGSLFCLYTLSVAAAPSIPHVFIPPPADKATLESSLHPIAPETVTRYLAQTGMEHVFRMGDELLAGHAAESMPIMGQCMVLGLQGTAFWGEALPDSERYVTDPIGAADGVSETPFPEDQRSVFLARIVCPGAAGLRLRIELSRLAPDDELWVLSSEPPRAFGPYRRDDELPGGRWLSSIGGNEAVLMVSSASKRAPGARLVGLCRLYNNEIAGAQKELLCHNHIACEQNAAIQELSTAVGIVLVPLGDDVISVCSGTLIASRSGAPFFLTASHCLHDPDTGQQIDAGQIEVIWDFRSTRCLLNDAPVIFSPHWNELPRSRAVRLLRTGTQLDACLLLLDDAPVGTLGRAYIGVDTRAAAVDEPVIGIHHPEGTAMRISYGAVDGFYEEHPMLDYTNQIRVVWDSGITEAGSSGSCLLFDDGQYRLFGIYSNWITPAGVRLTCIGSSWHCYTAYSCFHPFIRYYLDRRQPPDPNAGCPLSELFETAPEVVEALRAFRDDILLPSEMGRRVAGVYYQTAPALLDCIRRSNETRRLVAVATAPFATLERLLVETRR